MIRIRITDASAEYVSQICEIENAAFSDPWSYSSILSAVNDPLCRFILALDEDSDELFGYAIMRTLFEEGEVLSVAVRPDLRRKGIGRRMMKTLMCDASSRGVTKMFLEVRQSNEAARSMYTSLGFLPIGLRRGYYAKPREDAVIMRASLPQRNNEE